ncbi:MAG: hypothetical protein GY942_13230 [Aestuariibacter sp.]|nr:hypothetical protein [Aestuariibacter sp.]
MAGRKKITTNPEIVDEALPKEVIESIANTQNTVAMAAEMASDRDIANQLLGQIQMSMSISKFTDVVSLQKLQHIKENKIYRALSGQKATDRNGNEIADVGTFDGFCRALGTSASKVDEDLANLRNFGEEALQYLTKIGAGYRELRQYRRLPEDEKTALAEVAKSGNPEAFAELAETLIEKHVKEKEALTTRAEEAEANIEAQSEMLAKARIDRDEALHNLASAKRRIKRMAVDDAEKELRREAAEVAFGAELSLSRDLREVCSTVLSFAEEKGIDYRGYLTGMVRHLELKLVDLREEFGLDEDGNPEDFAWMGKEMLDSIEASEE